MFSIEVDDEQPPTITCPANQHRQGSGPVDFSPPQASDNCPGVSTMCAPPSGSVFPIGTSPVNCSAIDTFNNTASCGFAVAVASAAGAPAMETTALALLVALLALVGAWSARRRDAPRS
ncbi:MAG: HYR domain-containing protein [Pseudonocardiaceae bacterium]